MRSKDDIDREVSNDDEGVCSIRIYQVNDIVSVNGMIHLGLFKNQQNPSYTQVFQKIGTIIEASEYSDGVPIYDIQFDDIYGFRVNEDFIEKLTPQEIRSRQQAAEQRAQDQQQKNLEERILERRQQEQQILAAQQQQERQLAEARRKAGTKKATINRNDGLATYTQLRVEPNELSTFVIGSVLFNGIEVDILDGENGEWQHVGFSPNPGTEVSGWIRKKYLQNHEVERQLAEAGRAEAKAKKALVNRNDGGADFIKLRETPNLSSNFKNIPDLPNGTIVDILDENAEWQYVRFSPDRDTDVRGWVKKIYLQNQ